MLAKKSQPTLLGLPAELRLEIIEHLLQGFEGSRVYCCHCHVGETNSSFRYLADMGIFGSRNIVAERAIANLAQTCKVLSMQVRDTLYANIVFNYCSGTDDIGLARNRLRFHNMSSTSAYAKHESGVEGVRQISLKANIRYVRKACVIIEIPSERPTHVASLLPPLGSLLPLVEGIDNIDFMMCCLTTPESALKELRVHFRKQASFRAGQEEDRWAPWQASIIDKYLRSLERIPNAVDLSISLESLNDRHDQPNLFLCNLPSDSAEAKHIVQLCNNTRMKQSIPVTLLDRWMSMRDSIFAEFPWVSMRNDQDDPSYHSILGDHGYDDEWGSQINALEPDLFHAVQDLWMAHWEGNEEAFGKGKLRLLQVWEKSNCFARQRLLE